MTDEELQHENEVRSRYPSYPVRHVPVWLEFTIYLLATILFAGLVVIGGM